MKYTNILLIVIAGYITGCAGSRVSIQPPKSTVVIANWNALHSTVDSFYLAADQKYSPSTYSSIEGKISYLTAQDSARPAHGILVRQDLLVFKTFAGIDKEHSLLGTLNQYQANIYKNEMDIVIQARLDAENNLPNK